MEKTRRLATGRLSEVLGEKTLPVDKFFRSLGIPHMAAWQAEKMDKEMLDTIQAYADGINAFVRGIDTFGSNPTARLLPPEFILLGITKENWRPWTP